MNRRVILFLAIAAAAVAQEPVFRSEARLVEVPVVVRDRKTGIPVTGLTVDDFELRENGKRQVIEAFGLFDGRQAATQESKVEAGVFTNRRPVSQEGATVVALVIDGANSRFEDQHYAGKAAAEVIAKTRQPVRWGIYFLGDYRIKVLHDYSDDGESLLRRLGDLRGANRGLSALSDADADAGVQVGGRLGVEQEFAILRTLENLRAIGDHLRGLPGRKSLIWMTNGFNATGIIQRRPGAWYATLRRLNDANVSVYVVDSEGVRLPQGFSAERSAGRTGIGPSGISRNDGLDSMYGLADNTGGRVYRGTNNLAKGVESAVSDSQVFYRLAYRPVHGKWDGRYLKLEVRVKGGRYEVRHRVGYFAASEKSVVADRERALQDAVMSPLEATGIGLRATAKRSEYGYLEVSMLIEPGSVSLSPDGGRWVGQVDLRYALHTAEGSTLDDITDEIKLRLPEAEAKRLADDGLYYARRITLKDGATGLKVVVADRSTGRVGSVRVRW